MPCEHLGPQDLIELAEERLRREGVEPARWNGAIFGFGENLDEGMWRSVYTEIERRDGGWVVTRIDRRNEPLAENEEGLVRRKAPENASGS